MDQLDRVSASRPAGAGAGHPAGSGRRPGISKAALGKAKLGAIAVSVVAFLGSLVAVAQASPAAIARMNTAAAGQATLAQSAPVAPSSRFRGGSQGSAVAPLNLPQRPQMRNVRPLVRSRGS
ncbi:MAG TPA: hypothetical protein VGA61_14710 [Anaerolineae bacterium]